MSDLDPTEINALAILGADPDVRELASLERLRLAAKVAQAERNMSEKTRARRWTKERSGTVITQEELIGELNAAQKIEIDVAPLPVKEQARVMARQGMNVNEIAKALGLLGIDAPSLTTLRRMVRDIKLAAVCVGCAVAVRRPSRGMPRCYECKHPLCAAGCGKRASAEEMSPARVAARRGRPWACRGDLGRAKLAAIAAAMTPEQRSEVRRKGHATMTEALTPEQRSARSTKAQKAVCAAMTPEQRSERTRKGQATLRAQRAAQ